MKKFIAIALIAFVSPAFAAADKPSTLANQAQTPATAAQPMTVDQCKDALAKCNGDAVCEAGVRAKVGCEKVQS